MGVAHRRTEGGCSGVMICSHLQMCLSVVFPNTDSWSTNNPQSVLHSQLAFELILDSPMLNIQFHLWLCIHVIYLTDHQLFLLQVKSVYVYVYLCVVSSTLDVLFQIIKYSHMHTLNACVPVCVDTYVSHTHIHF